MNYTFLIELLFSILSFSYLIVLYFEIYQINIELKTVIISSSIMGTIIFILFLCFFEQIYLWIGITFLFLTLLLFLLTKRRNLDIIYYTSVVTILIFYSYMIVALFSRARYSINDVFCFSYYVYALMISAFILIFIVKVLKLKLMLPNNKIKYAIILLSISLMFIEIIFINYLSSVSVNIMFFVSFYIFLGLIFFSNNIIIQYLYNDFHQLTIISQNNLLSKITDSYIQGIHNEQEKVFKIRHDIKNNLIILQHLINNNQIAEANQVIDEINNHLKYKKSDVYTGNIFIDAYLTNVIVNSQIDVQIKCNDLNDLHYKPDIIAIIINLVDNAVENANHLVKIQIKRKIPNSILIKVSNDCEYDPSKHLKKSKKQGDHGYGLRIVKDVVNQYQGTYLTSYQNGMFTTYVMLNLEENDEK